MDNVMSADRIGLLVGVAATFDDFVECAATSDYLLKFKPAENDPDRRLRLKAAWDETYNPMVGSPITELIDQARRLGVTVFPRATLDDVRTASARCGVLIVLTHWKGSEILYEDISPACTTDMILDRARLHPGSLAAWMIEKTANHKGGGWFFRGRRKPPSIIKLLREAVELGWGTEPRDRIVDAQEALSVTLRARRRAEIDKMFAGLICPGNRIELFDGLHTKEMFERAISQTFHGLLDLTTCTSTILADHVSRTRAASLRLIQFPEEQESLWHVECLSIALELTVRHAVTYPKARLLAESSLKAALAEFTKTDCQEH